MRDAALKKSERYMRLHGLSNDPDLREKYLRTAPARLPLRRARAGVAGASSVDVKRRCGALHNFPGDHHLLDAFEARQVEHGVEQDSLHDRAQPPRTGLAVDCLAGDGAERFLR